MTARQKKNLTEWVAALRSGKYKQGKFNLCKNDEYCCLGVACEIKRKLEDTPTKGYKMKRNKINKSSLMPDHLWFKRTFGFDACEELFKGKKDKSVLSNLNDQDGLSFKRIATLIENKFLK